MEINPHSLEGLREMSILGTHDKKVFNKLLSLFTITRTCSEVRGLKSSLMLLVRCPLSLFVASDDFSGLAGKNRDFLDEFEFQIAYKHLLVEAFPNYCGKCLY